MQRFARPELESLEDRTALSTYKVDFSGAVFQGKILVSTNFNLILKAQDGTEYQRSFLFQANEDAAAVRDRVVAALTSAGWNSTTDGATAFQVTGHGAVANSEATHAAAYLTGILPAFQPTVTTVTEEQDEVLAAAISQLTFAF